MFTNDCGDYYVNLPYAMSKSGKDCFAIAGKNNMSCVLGYVVSNGNGTWSIARAGKKLRQVYASIDEAAKALEMTPGTKVGASGQPSQRTGPGPTDADRGKTANEGCQRYPGEARLP